MTRRLRVTLAATAGAAVLGAVAIALPAEAATPNLQFTLIQYDAPGSPDTDQPSSVNGEVVRIYNNSTILANLDLFTVKDAAGNTYTFHSRLLGAKKTVYVHTGIGTDGTAPDGTPDSARVYQQRGSHVWNNDGDTATLQSSSGRIYDFCQWTSRGTGRTDCGPIGDTVTVGPTQKPSPSLPTAKPSSSVSPRPPLPSMPAPLPTASRPSPPPAPSGSAGEPGQAQTLR